jgi:importin-7
VSKPLSHSSLYSYGDYLDDKSITALGVLQTIGTLILTLESTPDVLLHMESILMPVIKVTLENKLYGKLIWDLGLEDC